MNECGAPLFNRTFLGWYKPMTPRKVQRAGVVTTPGTQGSMGEVHGNGPAQPKYRLLHDALAALISDLPAGSGMPTERELCERFGVSRGTVRLALDHLE